MRRQIWMSSLALLVGSSGAWAQEQKPSIRVVDVASAPKIDGVLDEEVWTLAPAVTDFVRYVPTAGGPPEGQMEVRFAQDAKTLYVAVKISGVQSVIRARMAAREAINADDQVGIYLDPYGDGEDGFIFYFNPLGIQQDIQFSGGRWNTSWNAVYRSKGRVTDDGFELEVAFPFSALKYPRGETAQEWGLIITRKAAGIGEKYSWPVTERGAPRVLAQAGTLRGVRPPNRGSGIEIIPGIASRVTLREGQVVDPFEPWFDTVQPFLDLRYGLTANTGLIATVLPDFSQVESDTTPIRLNQRFDAQFGERRPFFTEGLGAFQDQPRTFYSRSIEKPLYGVKVAGKEKGWAIGLLNSVDMRSGSSFNENETPGFEPSEEPTWAVNTFARLRKDLGRKGYIGLTFLDKRRFDEGFSGPQRGWHDGLTLDGSWLMGNRWELRGFGSASGTGDGEQSLWGGAGGAQLSRRSGDGLGIDLDVRAYSDDYRQEMGFLTQSGLVASSLELDWTFPGKGALSTWRPYVMGRDIEEFKGESERAGGLGTELVFGGVHSVFAEAEVAQRIEGSPQPFEHLGWWASIGYGGQVGKELELETSVGGGEVLDYFNLAGAYQTSFDLTTTLRPGLGIRFDAYGRLNLLWPELGGQRLEALARGKLSWQFTRVTGLRLIGEWVGRRPEVENPWLNSWSGSAMLSFLWNPFSSVFAGYQAIAPRPWDTNPVPLTHQFFVRASIYFRP